MQINNLIHPNLHGSRAGHSTATALSQLYDSWVDEVENGSMVGVLICDQSAAFDLCDHGLLLDKLKLLGVEESALCWFSSYLKGRKQSCIVDGQISAPLNIPNCGVPQGSIGGPILWLIFTCDQPDVIHNHNIDIGQDDRGCSNNGTSESGGCGALVGYVDDGAFSYANQNPSVLSAVLTEKYSKLAEWMSSNKLVINPDKTHLMVMGHRRHNNLRSEVSVKAGEFEIVPTESEKLLGAQLHQNLGWGCHIRDHKLSLLNQLSSRINGLKKICGNATFTTRLMVANGVVISKLTYLITLWGGSPQYLINALQIQQLKAARLVCGFASYRWSRKQLLARVGWLSVRQLIFYHTVLQTCKTLATGRPKHLYTSLSLAYPRATRNSAAGNIRQSGHFCNNTFRYRAEKFFNQVPPDVRTGPIATVKPKLKKWIAANVPID